MSVFTNVISPYDEMLAYEALWFELGSEKQMADFFRQVPGKKPSEALLYFVHNDKKEYALRTEKVESAIISRLSGFSVSIHGDFQYPNSLRGADYPVEIIYYTGDINLLDSKCISIVGTRNPSLDGVRRAKKITKLLVEQGFTIVSGLASGIDTASHVQAIESGGRTIGVLGTPIDKYYPAENRNLQDIIKEKYLLVSQVPFFVHKKKNGIRRMFFPRRNVTMAAISIATVIVEAGETSGTLIQAMACIDQGKKLFLLNSLFENNTISWPEKYEKKGAVRVNSVDDLLSRLNQ